MAQLYEILMKAQPGTKLLNFSELMQRIGQCLGRKTDLPQGVHLNVIKVYHGLIRLFDSELEQHLDTLFAPLLPLYAFATIPTKKELLKLFNEFVDKKIDVRFVGPIVASILSTDPADPEEADGVKALLKRLEDLYHEEYIKSLFGLLPHPCEARHNVLQTIYLNLKQALENGSDLSVFDGHEDNIIVVLHSPRDDEVRLGLDIVQMLYPIPNAYDSASFSLFSRLSQAAIELLGRDQTIVSRVENWLFSKALPETYSRLTFAALVQLFGCCSDRLQLVKSLFTELGRRDEALDAFLAAFPVLVNEVFSFIPQNELSQFL